MDNTSSKHMKSVFLVSLMVLSVLLPGCIESTPEEDEDGSLSDTDMNDLVFSLGISDSRAEEIRSSSLRA